MKAFRIITFILSLSVIPVSWGFYSYISGPGLFGTYSDNQDIAWLYLLLNIIPIASCHLLIKGSIQHKNTRGEKVIVSVLFLASLIASVLLAIGIVTFFRPF